MSGWGFEPNVFEVRHGRTNSFKILVLKIFWSTCLMATTSIKSVILCRVYVCFSITTNGCSFILPCLSFLLGSIFQVLLRKQMPTCLNVYNKSNICYWEFTKLLKVIHTTLSLGSWRQSSIT